MAETYSLRSGPAEREQDRLSKGHGLLYDITGDLLPPHIALDHQASLKVADIATGTGAWLVQLQTTLSPTSTFVGFDITSALFQPAGSLPANVSLHVHDMREPFPASHIGAFEIVHARLLMYAFKASEWAHVIANLITLLRPGGYLFWEDTNYDSWMSIPASPAHARALEVDMRASVAAGRDLKYIGKLKRWFGEAGLVDVTETVHSSWDVSTKEAEAQTTALMIRLHEQSLKGALERGGVEGLRSVEDFEELIADVKKDMEGGKSIGLTLRRIVGRKPGSEA